jgi:hypothetical protein
LIPIPSIKNSSLLLIVSKYCASYLEFIRALTSPCFKSAFLTSIELVITVIGWGRDIAVEEEEAISILKQEYTLFIMLPLCCTVKMEVS